MHGTYLRMLLLFLAAARGPGELLAQEATPPGALTVIAVGLESEQGTVKMALSHSEQDYQGQAGHRPFRAASVTIGEGRAVHTFAGLPRGDYALKLFHDVKSNDRLDTNFLGIPTESYAFSNDAQARFGPPAYDKAKFSLDSPHQTLRIDFR